MDPVHRFSPRVEACERCRPGYPPAVLSFLARECGLNAYSEVADIGSGTGIFTRLLLDFGCAVTAVEPNPEMRAAAERELGRFERFHSAASRPEHTGLPDHSFDLVTVAQAFHSIDPVIARDEFARILRPPRWVALVSNRISGSDAFGRAYESLLERYAGPECRKDDRTAEFWQGAHPVEEGFENLEHFSFERLAGLIDSSSRTPPRGTERHTALLDELRALFEAHAADGVVGMHYETTVSAGALPPRPCSD